MSSSLVTRFQFLVGGSPIVFASPFAVPSLALEAEPAIYDVVIAADGTANIWDGAPLPTDFDVLALSADQSCDVEFNVNSGAAKFTLFLRGGGYPLLLQGSDSYQGGLAGALQSITSIQAKNRNTTTAAVVSVLLGKVA